MEPTQREKALIEQEPDAYIEQAYNIQNFFPFPEQVLLRATAWDLSGINTNEKQIHIEEPSGWPVFIHELQTTSKASNNLRGNYPRPNIPVNLNCENRVPKPVIQAIGEEAASIANANVLLLREIQSSIAKWSKTLDDTFIARRHTSVVSDNETNVYALAMAHSVARWKSGINQNASAGDLENIVLNGAKRYLKSVFTDTFQDKVMKPLNALQTNPCKAHHDIVGNAIFDPSCICAPGGLSIACKECVAARKGTPCVLCSQNNTQFE